MRALSIAQPWAWLILHGGRNIENRWWQTTYRGRVLIHANKRWQLYDYESALVFARRIGGLDLARRVPHFQNGGIELGGIVGAATLVDVLLPTPHPVNPWHLPGQYGFVFQDPEPLPFYPTQGESNFWGSFTLRDGRVTPA
jgi:hypothetical protein